MELGFLIGIGVGLAIGTLGTLMGIRRVIDRELQAREKLKAERDLLRGLIEEKMEQR